ncbi:Predicted protein [Taphrina deformans PYCC 5710]|uniref:RING-CH-type domain-containing protein n=1 Tax=Taphrina deformans (strain PYCC 5710 / ATCC 11124 / CBS 356.35 / IMI 108563 / JCM 9778 / NBRC 8474) TaxID=1097556 RepID=R4X6D7_TAPDE|nr:Predicted protein [Taphrina deformans PYCC 5710]|eukprot:CCG80600.1 Predicted protein [Taphrina deformans PYCC 5710]
MDDEIRLRRARQWGSSTAARADLSHAVEEESHTTQPKPFNFGTLESKANHDVSEPTATSIAGEDSMTSHESDGEIMRRQLMRKSTPYAQVFPSVKPEPESKFEFEPTNIGAQSQSFPQTPSGSYPEDLAQSDSVPKQEEKPTPTTKMEESQAQDERTCRICFSPESPDEKLISPCKCRGTSKWIHISCLDQWRMHSQNSKSFYRCDQCHYEYSFRRTDLANLLLSRWTLLALTCVAFTTATFFGGFLVKLGLFLMPSSYTSGHSSWYSNFTFFYTPLDAGTDILTAASALIPSTPHTWQDIFVVDVWHFIQGIISLGILGIVGFMGTGGIFSLRTFHPRRTRRQGDGIGLAEFAFILVIVLGCGKVALSMWRRVREVIQKRLADLGERILEVDPDRP